MNEIQIPLTLYVDLQRRYANLYVKFAKMYLRTNYVNSESNKDIIETIDMLLDGLTELQNFSKVSKN